MSDGWEDTCCVGESGSQGPFKQTDLPAHLRAHAVLNVASHCG